MNKHVNKVGVFRDTYQTKELCSNFSKTWWLFHQTSLIAVHQKYVHHVQLQPPQGTIPLTFCESPHLHQKRKVGILVPIFFWVLEG